MYAGPRRPDDASLESMGSATGATGIAAVIGEYVMTVEGVAGAAVFAVHSSVDGWAVRLITA